MVFFSRFPFCKKKGILIETQPGTAHFDHAENRKRRREKRAQIMINYSEGI